MLEIVYLVLRRSIDRFLHLLADAWISLVGKVFFPWWKFSAHNDCLLLFNVARRPLQLWIESTQKVHKVRRGIVLRSPPFPSKSLSAFVKWGLMVWWCRYLTPIETALSQSLSCSLISCSLMAGVLFIGVNVIILGKIFCNLSSIGTRYIVFSCKILPVYCWWSWRMLLKVTKNSPRNIFEVWRVWLLSLFWWRCFKVQLNSLSLIATKWFVFLKHSFRCGRAWFSWFSLSLHFLYTRRNLFFLSSFEGFTCMCKHNYYYSVVLHGTTVLAPH